MLTQDAEALAPVCYNRYIQVCAFHKRLVNISTIKRERTHEEIVLTLLVQRIMSGFPLVPVPQPLPRH